MIRMGIKINGYDISRMICPNQIFHIFKKASSGIARMLSIFRHGKIVFVSNAIGTIMPIDGYGMSYPLSIGRPGCIQAPIWITQNDDIFIRDTKHFQSCRSLLDSCFCQITSVPIGCKNTDNMKSLLPQAVNRRSCHIDFIIFMRNKYHRIMAFKYIFISKRRMIHLNSPFTAFSNTLSH